MPDPISLTGSPGQPLAAVTTSPASPAVARPTQDTSASPVTQGSVVLPQDETRPAPSAPTSRPKSQPDKASVEDALKSFREFLKTLPSNLEVREDQETGIVVYKVVNPITNEVIRQYPPDEMVEAAKRMKRLASSGESGILLDHNL